MHWATDDFMGDKYELTGPLLDSALTTRLRRAGTLGAYTVGLLCKPHILLTAQPPVSEDTHEVTVSSASIARRKWTSLKRSCSTS